MTLKECMLIENKVYKAGVPMDGGKPYGIVVHSTGCNNPNLKRYVQPVPSQPYYQEVLDDIGVNPNHNDWNRSNPDPKACVGAMIGKNAKGVVETYQTMPWDMCEGGVWKGKLLKQGAPCYSNSGKGTVLFRTTEPNMLPNNVYFGISNNGIAAWTYNGQTVYIDSSYLSSFNNNPTACFQFEMLEDNLTDEVYFNAVMLEAQEFCAYICTKFDIPVSHIWSHKESFSEGYGSNHGDPENWLSKFGKNMNWFRQQVQNILGGGTIYTIKSVNNINNSTLQLQNYGIDGDIVTGRIMPGTNYRFISAPEIILNGSPLTPIPEGKNYKFEFTILSNSTITLNGSTIQDTVEIAFGDTQPPDGEWVALSNYQSKVPKFTEIGEHQIKIWIRRPTGGSTYVYDENNPYTVIQKIYSQIH